MTTKNIYKKIFFLINVILILNFNIGRVVAMRLDQFVLSDASQKALAERPEKPLDEQIQKLREKLTAKNKLNEKYFELNVKYNKNYNLSVITPELLDSIVRGYRTIKMTSKNPKEIASFALINAATSTALLITKIYFGFVLRLDSIKKDDDNLPFFIIGSLFNSFTIFSTFCDLVMSLYIACKAKKIAEHNRKQIKNKINKKLLATISIEAIASLIERIISPLILPQINKHLVKPHIKKIQDKIESGNYDKNKDTSIENNLEFNFETQHVATTSHVQIPLIISSIAWLTRYIQEIIYVKSLVKNTK